MSQRAGQATAFWDDPTPDRNKWLRPGMMSSDSQEWYTPPFVIEAVRRTLGAIDLDPCADPERTVPAAEHLTEVENGLGRQWSGRVYMNPPYGRGIIAWTTKLRDEMSRGWVSEAVALLPARVDTRWWHELDPQFVCFIRGRIQFSGYGQSAPFPSAAAYFGPHPEAFVSAFKRLGAIYRAVE